MPSYPPRSYAAHKTDITRQKQITWCSDDQKACFEYGPGPNCASGGFGSGKTLAHCLKVLAISDLFPRNRGVIARRVWEELKTTAMSTFFKFCPPEAYQYGGRRADSEKYLRLNNGSEILWMHLDDPETENVIKGLEINWFFISQAEEVEEEIFTKLSSRLGRWDQCIVPQHLIDNHRLTFNEDWPWRNEETGQYIPPTYALLDCNPDTEMHWIYRRFHPESLEHRAKYQEKGYKMFIMNSMDNIFLPRQNKEALTDQDESFQRRYVRGEWGIPEGRIHDIPESSIIPGSHELLHYLLETCTLHRTLDHGDTAPTVCMWWAVDRQGNVFGYREYYQPDQLVSYHRQEITSLSAQEKYLYNYADPAIFIKQQQKHGGRWSTADEYSDSQFLPPTTALYWEAGDNNEMGTRNRINEYLRYDPDRIHPVTKQRGSPRLFFLQKNLHYPQGCDFSIRETRSQRRVKIGTEMGKPIFSEERDEKIPDHAYDTVRYFIASRPPIAKAPKPYRSAKSFDAIRRQTNIFYKKGGAGVLARQARNQAMGFRNRPRRRKSYSR